MPAPPTSSRRHDVRQDKTLGNRFRFLLRLLGLTGLVASAFGAALLIDAGPDLSEAPSPMRASFEWGVAAIRGEHSEYAQIGALALGAGLAVVLVWLLTELITAIALSSGRKTAASTNNTLQVILAAGLLVVVNAISFHYYWRADQTRSREFTFSEELVKDLGQLRSDSPTTVVVLQLHKTAGTLSDKPDAYDYAAERKVVEKVRDLVDQLREFGPRFNVVVLDVEDEGYERAVREVTRKRPGLAEAIAVAPENSIFFYADGKVRRVPREQAERLSGGLARPATAPDPEDGGQALVYPGAVTRLSFAEFYQLDKTASREATPREREGAGTLIGGLAFAPGVRGKGNLVLIPRGKEAFVRKVLALEERKPRIGLAVIHPLLTSRENYEEYTAAGLRHSLEMNGFEVVDVILKRWSRGTGPTPAAYTYEESELDRVESRYQLFNLLSHDRELAIRQLQELRKRVEKATLPELDRIFGRQLGRRITDEEDRRLIRTIVDNTIEVRQQELAEFTKQLAEVGIQYRDLLRNERAAENRRVTDLKAKLRQYVADCDLLIVPRLTVVDIARGDVIPPSLFHLAHEQAEVVKEFLKAGKPVLFAMGPTNVDPRAVGADSAGDEVERLLPQLGIELGRQTILTDPEAQAIAERQGETLGTSVEVPPLVFDRPEPDGKRPNPVAEAYRVTARSVDRELQLRKSGFRPVYVARGMAHRLPYAAEIMHTTRESWNEEKPLPEDDVIPKFEPAKPDDPKRGSRDEERRGPFPVGVAVETRVPVDWLDPSPESVGSLVGAAGPAVIPVGFGPHFLGAAAAYPHDRALYAAGVSVAAEQQSRPTVRVVALGHGGIFTGKRLEPAQETLLLHSINWQLGRDDRLPKDVPDEQKWRYPRVDLSPSEVRAWWLATWLGLPALTIYLGLIALMIRRLR